MCAAFNFAVSKRLELTILLFFGVAILYFLRVNMSVAVQQIIIDLNWTETEKGLVLVRIYVC